MTMTRKRAVIGAVVISLLVGAAVAGIVISRSNGKAGVPSHAVYARMYAAAIPGKTRISVLDQWPKPPYQSYHDNFDDQCYQWREVHVALYNLCFRRGTLAFKTVE
jgi:hypothetical protein